MSDWEDKLHYWVVICKNRHFHEQQNFWAGYKIFLAETDSYSPLGFARPKIPVKCDSCGQEYEYKLKEILRFESDPVETFVEHPLFREGNESETVEGQHQPHQAPSFPSDTSPTSARTFSFFRGLFGRSPSR